MRLVVPVLATALATAALATVGATAHAAPDGGRSASVARTHRIVVRPVDRDGHPVSGWTVHRARGSVSCDGTSAASVSKNVVECFPTAEYLPACWASTHHTVLCLRDARRQRLVRIGYTGTIHATDAPKRPSPLDLDLAGGQGCSIRMGGAWSTLPSHPDWLGFYSCDHGSVYGPPSGDGLNRSRQPWSVHVWKSGTAQQVAVRDVRRAYYVGTRR